MRYKCIKEYPGGPPLGTILTYDEESKLCLSMSSSYPVYFMNPDRIEYFSEYWEKISESDLTVDHIKDLVRIEVFRWGGVSGGQHVNKVDSAIRLTCEEFYFRVECAYYRSQHQNREACLEALQAFLDKLPNLVKQYYIK